MVSRITVGYPTDAQGRPYRRRRYRPALIVATVLVAASVAAWATALTNTGAESVPTDCNQPTAAGASLTQSAPAIPTQKASTPKPAGANATGATSAGAFTAVDRTEMLAVAPAPLSTFQVRVLNASNTHGQARSVSDDLTAQGFNPVPNTAYADDARYPNHDLNCVAQIRFGPAGKGAAAAVWLAIPCAQLIDDGRKGTSVDVALGQYYTSREQSQDTQAALEALRLADPRNPKTTVDPSLVSAVHTQRC
ncbi:MAG: envelope integrity protein Cei [Gordonia sp. (in: high G+C Gram-positive bacteria)]